MSTSNPFAAKSTAPDTSEAPVEAPPAPSEDEAVPEAVDEPKVAKKATTKKATTKKAAAKS